MAYEIISQNNNTTTLSDGTNTITVPSRVVLATGTTYEITEVNNSTATLEGSDGSVIRDVPCVAVLAGSGGGTVDKSKIVNADTIPAASESNSGYVYLYTGATNANYTHGYVYQNVKTATYTGTVSFEAATLSGTTVACSGDNFAVFLTEAGADPTPIVSGTMTYEADATGWRLVGKDSNGDTVTTFLEYVEDYQDAGFTFTGTPQDGDVIAFTCSVTEASASYAWNRIDVQPQASGLPSQTGNSGKFLTTDGTDASWSDKPLVNMATGDGGIGIGNASIASGDGSIAIGDKATGVAGAGPTASGKGSIAIGSNTATTLPNHKAARATGLCSIAISTSTNSEASGMYSIVMGAGSSIAYAEGGVVIGGTNNTVASAAKYSMILATNSVQANRTVTDQNSLYFRNNVDCYKLLSNDGTIPEARLADTTNATTGDVLQLDSNGNAVWAAGGGGGGLPSQTGNSGKFLTTDGTNASWGSALKNTATGSMALTIDGTSSNRPVSINIGFGSAVTADGAIQIGMGTNSEAGTVSISTFKNNQATPRKILDADGYIPTERLTKVKTVRTLASANWSSNTQTVTVTGITTTGVVLVSPDPTDQAAYTSAGIICTTQAANSLTFTCTSTPSADIDVNVVML